MNTNLIDHLYRQHRGKMVSVLTKIFGLSNLQVIEDAIQDTFLKASKQWKQEDIKNPEAWLTQAAKNRVLDLFRKLKNEQEYLPETKNGLESIGIRELFLDTEIEDAQLRMIFTACHPTLHPKDRISFALKTISGFSSKEIAVALLTKEATIKKRIQRARKTIQQSAIQFKIPQGKELPLRIQSVLEVLYLIFNEGFHSNNKKILIRKELCGEAMRLCKAMLQNKHTNIADSYALFALMCFHAARLEAKVTTANELVDLKTQDRNKWSFPLIQLGNTIMDKAVETQNFSVYHFEAAIVAEHIKAPSFEQTNWTKIQHWYQELLLHQPCASHVLSLAVISLQQKNYVKANYYFNQLEPQDLEQRAYLFHSAKADYFMATNNYTKALLQINTALNLVNNSLERNYLENKKKTIITASP